MPLFRKNKHANPSPESRWAICKTMAVQHNDFYFYLVLKNFFEKYNMLKSHLIAHRSSTIDEIEKTPPPNFNFNLFLSGCTHWFIIFYIV